MNRQTITKEYDDDDDDDEKKTCKIKEN